MKIPGLMSASKTIRLSSILLLCFLVSFSQENEKKDAFFILDESHADYLISYYGNDDELKQIELIDSKEHEYHQKKVKEAKEKGDYYYDRESGTDNLNIKVTNHFFDVRSHKKIKLNAKDGRIINAVDYDWIKENAWKIMPSYDAPFNKLYFLHKEEKEGVYKRYEVYMTISSH